MLSSYHTIVIMYVSYIVVMIQPNHRNSERKEGRFPLGIHCDKRRLFKYIHNKDLIKQRYYAWKERKLNKNWCNAREGCALTNSSRSWEGSYGTDERYFRPTTRDVRSGLFELSDHGSPTHLPREYARVFTAGYSGKYLQTSHWLGCLPCPHTFRSLANARKITSESCEKRGRKQE